MEIDTLWPNSYTLYATLVATGGAGLLIYKRRATNPPTITPAKPRKRGIFAAHGSTAGPSFVAVLVVVLTWSLFIGVVAVANQVPFYEEKIGLGTVSLGVATINLAVVTPVAIEGVSWCFTLMAVNMTFRDREARNFLRWMWFTSSVIAAGNAIHNYQRGDITTGLLIGGLSLTGPLLMHYAVHVMVLRTLFGKTVQNHQHDKRVNRAQLLRLVAGHVLHPVIALRALSYWAANAAWTYSQAWHVAATGWRVHARRTITESAHKKGARAQLSKRGTKGGQPRRGLFKRRADQGDQAPDHPAPAKVDQGDQHPVTTPDVEGDHPRGDQGEQPRGEQGDQGGDQAPVHGGDQGGDHPALIGLDHPAEDPLLADALNTLTNQVTTPGDLDALFKGDQPMTRLNTPDQGGDHPRGEQGADQGDQAVGHPGDQRGEQGDHPRGDQGEQGPDHPPVNTLDQGGDQAGVNTPDHPGDQQGDQRADQGGEQGGDHPPVNTPDHPTRKTNRKRVTTPRKNKPNKGDQGGDQPRGDQGDHPTTTVTASSDKRTPRAIAADHFRDLISRGEDPDHPDQPSLNEVARRLQINRSAVVRGLRDARTEHHKPQE